MGRKGSNLDFYILIDMADKCLNVACGGGVGNWPFYHDAK